MSEPEKQAPKGTPLERRKMTLEQQSIFLSQLLRRCQMQGPEMRGIFAGEAFITLTRDDMSAIDAIQQTIALFEMHGADRMVRDKIMRRRSK
jgi:hypothetical protein